MSALAERLISWRRVFHAHPEPGFCEFGTAARLVRELRQSGYEVTLGHAAMDMEAVYSLPRERTALWLERAREGDAPAELLAAMEGGATAVVAERRGGDGPTVAFRFDMDALPVAEAIDAEHAPSAEGFASTHDGYMHACGHDGHMAIGLGVAHALAEAPLRGTVRLIFQPAEEGAPGGAAAIAARGLVDDVDYLVCSHLGLQANETGAVVCSTEFMGTSKYRVRFSGRAAHVVAAPETGRNALLAAAQAALALHAIAPHAGGWFSVNVGVLHAGTEQGVTPAEALIELGLWADELEVQDYVRRRVAEIVEGAAAAAGVEAAVEHIGEAPSTPGDPELAAVAHRAASSVDGIHRIEDFTASRAGEDATVLLGRVSERGGKGIYALIGSTLASGHHTPRFDFDERSLEIGTDWLAQIARELLA